MHTHHFNKGFGTKTNLQSYRIYYWSTEYCTVKYCVLVVCSTADFESLENLLREYAHLVGDVLNQRDG